MKKYYRVNLIQSMLSLTLAKILQYPKVRPNIIFHCGGGVSQFFMYIILQNWNWNTQAALLSDVLLDVMNTLNIFTQTVILF